jgi:hypothetical protein
MGFMDKFKDTQEQAQAAAKAGQGSVAGMGGWTPPPARAQKTQKITQSGVKTPATLTSMTETGKHGPPPQRDRVRDRGGGQARARRALQGDVQPAADPAVVDAYNGKVGQEITVNVDPDDPNSMLLRGRGFRLGAPLGAEDAGRRR